MYANLPECIEAVSLAYRQPTVKHRVDALYTCGEKLDGDTQGHSIEDVRVKVSLNCVRIASQLTDTVTAEVRDRPGRLPSQMSPTIQVGERFLHCRLYKKGIGYTRLCELHVSEYGR